MTSDSVWLAASGWRTAAYARVRYAASLSGKNLMTQTTLRTCSKCGASKAPGEFDLLKRKGRVSRSGVCMDCRRARYRALYRSKKAIPRRVPPRFPCRECDRFLPASEFYRDNRYGFGLVPVCKRCRLKQMKSYGKTPAGRDSRRRAKRQYAQRGRASKKGGAAA